MTVTAQREHEVSTGARPAGATSEASAAANVQQMFDSIAPRYDLLNHLLSVGLDRRWWARAAASFRNVLARPEASVLDLCCGTGDMALALMKYRPAGVGEAPLLAVDFSPEMLARGRQKFVSHNIVAIEADAMHLPMADASLDLVTSAFGFRNLANYDDGLAELFRVLRPGGQIGILECNQPEGVTGALYNLYFKRILPVVGGMISGDAAAYKYLPASVERFPRPPRMLEMIRSAGFRNASWTGYTFGTAGLYRATKP
ncbi:bifunctional demethylmenaquinone methyltransferase/2-methoxy-6-polyprenyl-1,4-benzoquinol methylase UbiE [Edaphobacter flagellatus]|uniref:bifunctional demethylmenaquinone methyltransferase/2-methoxy-6-polyprenyl-1,4-benzoquinol methylase UbiE n=1 Tax=Edaphobacter flagellatus TaxID=1933044 RepID=UPI0021B17EC3|nr:bifunctional demethylmenaquinone methyltransferase/2-methoxy-6-polyprenyl-1,4-benzoquinol methylase UbiE [Edaphobacter flagellatus]